MTAETLPDVADRPWAPPTRFSGLVFAAKAAVLRVRRAAHDVAAGPPPLPRAEAIGFPVEAGVSRTPLWPDAAQAEQRLQRGKVQNLRLAGRALDGLVVSAGTVFSFWRQVGPPLAVRGYTDGRMLREGCMVASRGGGLCQLSNALYDAALQAGCRILERHAHSRIVPGSAAALGRDATVAWNYVDLRFASDRDLRLNVRMDREQLIVQLHARTGRVTGATQPGLTAAAVGVPARSCASCGEQQCFRHRPYGPDRQPARAFLVDDAWPEFEAYLGSVMRENDGLYRPWPSAMGAAVARSALVRMA